MGGRRLSPPCTSYFNREIRPGLSQTERNHLMMRPVICCQMHQRMVRVEMDRRCYHIIPASQGLCNRDAPFVSVDINAVNSISLR